MSETVEQQTQVGQFIAVERPPAAIFIPSIDDGLEAWQAYQNLCKQLLDDSDYATIRGKKHRKRTAWTKLRRALNISVGLTEAEWEELGEEDFGYRVTVRASFPGGRFEDGDGYCDSFEMRGSNIEPTRHNVRAKAITRAKNRATSDIIGAGEVSAEEMTEGEIIAGGNEKRQPARRAKQSRPSNNRPSRWENFLADNGISEEKALKALGTASVTGWMKANPGKTETDAHAEILQLLGKA